MKIPKPTSIIWLLLVLVVVFLIRLPSLWEPHWYGDEEIYLAIGQALQRGAVLYRDIWDNKPPLLYILYAISPTLLWAKATATLFVLGTVTSTYYLTKNLLLNTKYKILNTPKSEWLSLSASLLVGIMLSLPILEGTIANAELFFTLPIVIGAYIIYKRLVADPDGTLSHRFLLGFLIFLAFLFKVPAVFDFIGMFIAVMIIGAKENYTRAGIVEKFARVTLDLSIYFIPILLAFFLPLFLVFGYFYFNHAIGDFITASFLQNASYVSVDSGALSKLSNPLFIKALLLLLSSLALLVLFWKNRISKQLLFLSFWFGFSIYGALLSNRNYAHYLLQAIPPAFIFLFYVLANLKKYWLFLAIPIVVWASLYQKIPNKILPDFSSSFALPTFGYYKNWWNYVSGQKSWTNYARYFDSSDLNNYKIANYLKANSSKLDSIFVWGDNASIYVLSDRKPATKFIQAHHLTTIDKKNYDLVIQQLATSKPKFILVSRPVHFAFPKLEELVAKNYNQVAIFKNIYLYKLTK